MTEQSTHSTQPDKPTAEEVFGSLTGFDEIAIANQFTAEVGTLADEKPTMFLRSLVFALRRRQGLSDREAYAEVMEMPLGDVNDYFAEEGDFEAGEGSRPVE